MENYIRRLVKEYGLCVWCIGRQITTDPKKFQQTGEKIYKNFKIKPKKSCWLCNGFFENRELVEMMLNEIKGFEFDTLDFGIVVDPQKIEFEDELRAKYKITNGLTLKKAILSYLRYKFENLYKIKIRTDDPDLKILVDLEHRNFVIYTKPTILELRFLKYDSKAKIRANNCKVCKGKGCNFCEWTGKENDSSLESFFLFKLNRITGGRAKIRWSVRDFEDSRIYGLGRPAYLLFKNIKKMKSLPFLIPYKPVRGFQISLARNISKKEMRDVFTQTTLIHIKTSRTLSNDELKFANTFFKNKIIHITDKNKTTRRKMVYFLKIHPIHDRKYEILLKHETGLNLKKFLCGNEGGSVMDIVLTDLFENVRFEIEDIVVLNVEEKIINNHLEGKEEGR